MTQEQAQTLAKEIVPGKGNGSVEFTRSGASMLVDKIAAALLQAAQEQREQDAKVAETVTGSLHTRTTVASARHIIAEAIRSQP